jgi:serine/threonine-protein kinase
MGEVYRAEDTKLKRTVALKRLAPRLRDDPACRHRFQEEAERVSPFTDPHVAALYDVVEDGNETFFVMEYVEGETLRRRLGRPVSIEDFFAIAIQCAEALSAAHRQGIVHCDIKPENIMLTPEGQVKVLDFGVAKCLPRDDQSTTVDRSTMLGGTPAYMSPEVLEEHLPDPRADLFSLGVVFYEMLTGQHPFLAGSFVATTDRVRKETPAPIGIFNRKAPAELNALVQKLMAKDPSQRYASAAALLSDLHSFQAGVAPPIHLSRATRSSGRKWIWATVAVAVIMVITFASYRRAHSRPLLAERGWVLVTDFENRGATGISDEGVREGLTIALQQSRYVNVFPRSRAYEALQRMEQPETTRIDEALGREICRREGLQVLLAGTIEQVGHAVQITIRAVDPIRGNLLIAEKERFEREDQFFDKADELAKRVRQDLGESLGGIETNSRPLAKVTTRSFEALQLYSRASDDMAAGQTDQVAALLESALKLDPSFAMSHLLLAQYYAALVGRNEQAFTELQSAYGLRQNVSDREQRRIEAAYYAYQEQYERAVQALSVLISLYPDDVEAHEDLAGAYNDIGQSEKSIQELREVVRLKPFSPQAYGSLILRLTATSAFDEGLAVARQAQQKGLDSPRLHWGAGMAYFGKGDLAAARNEFRRLQASGAEFDSLGTLCLTRVDLYEGKFTSATAELEADIRKENESHTKGLQLIRQYLLGEIALALGDEKLAARRARLILAAPQADLQTVDYAVAGTLYARSGEIAAARRVLKHLNEIRTATPSAWNKTSYFQTAGEVALAEHRPAEAMARFGNAAAAFPGVPPIEALARTYEARNDCRPAAESWKAVLASRGESLQEWFPANVGLAHLHLARAYVCLGNAAAADSEYHTFLAMFQNGDDIPARHQAQQELKALARDASREFPPASPSR